MIMMRRGEERRGEERRDMTKRRGEREEVSRAV
jgi:hypothetical protein